ncbi:hypothetical protein AOLI_G00221050 [Acnodon oligacanthus]
MSCLDFSNSNYCPLRNWYKSTPEGQELELPKRQEPGPLEGLEQGALQEQKPRTGNRTSSLEELGPLKR